MGLLLIIRWMLARENRRRDAETKDTAYDDAFVEIMLADGTRVERKVEKVSDIVLLEGISFLSRGTRDYRNTWI